MITGGASGIGRASVIPFAEEGANVYVAGRQHAVAGETAAEVRKLGHKGTAVSVDVANSAQVSAMVAHAVKELGGIDIMLAAAGVSGANYGEGRVESKFLNNQEQSRRPRASCRDISLTDRIFRCKLNGASENRNRAA